MIKKAILSLCLCLFATGNIFAKKGKTQFSFYGGYEHFPELWDGKGYDVGVEFKYYVWKGIYTLANFHAGVNNGSKNSKYDRDGISYDFDMTNKVNDYMLGIGVGADLFHMNKHTIYLQGTVGIGVSEQHKDGIVTSPSGDYDIVKTFEEKSTRFAISASAGYDFQVTKWLSIGVNYTGWQIGYEYKNSVNAKIGFCF